MDLGITDRDIPICVILAAGRGKRMRSQSIHKVCFRVAGRPAILRAMDAYKDAGIQKFVVVVGAMSGQVIETVGTEYPEALFVYQPRQQGTGNATKAGIVPLQQLGYQGPVLVTMGDKLVDAEAIRQLMARFYDTAADCVVGTLPRQPHSEGGKVLIHRDGRFAGIVESRDIQKAMLLENAYNLLRCSAEESAAVLEEVAVNAATAIPDLEKRRLALGPLADALDCRDLTAAVNTISNIKSDVSFISLGATRFTPAEAAETKLQNAALYLFRAQALYEGLHWITADNAQQEEYLTDAVNYLANSAQEKGAFRVEHCVLNSLDVLTYNNPEELIAVEDQFRKRSKSSVRIEQQRLPENAYRTTQEWLALLDRLDLDHCDALETIYGSNTELIKERVLAYRDVLVGFGQRYGYDRCVILVRAPGRINVMGRHVEHRGGSVNVMAIGNEVILVAAPREDDVVSVANTQEALFPHSEFRIGKEIAGLPWDDWIQYINNEHVQGLVRDSAGNWVNYVKAAFLRLQCQCRDRRIMGMDAVIGGNIPMAAGLSSSSAIVVASAEAAAALNDVDLAPQDFVDLCGEGEWYVGTRGGAGDHAAMKFSQRGQLTQLGFFPFCIKGSVIFPDNYRLVVANSHVMAKKTTNAKDTFNQRVASYEFALMLLRDRYPQFANKMERLRDVNPQTLGVLPSDIYQMLLALPEKMTVDEVRDKLGDTDNNELLSRILGSHITPDHYLIRSVALYGIAECRRAELAYQLLKARDIEALGRLMNVSHDGDRVVCYKGGQNAWKATPYDYLANDGYLSRLISDLKSEDPERVQSAQLPWQPGGYACSTPEIDEMVDISISVPGVLGAQLSGAGLGGCIMVLLHNDKLQDLTFALAERFYMPRQLEPAITVSVPVKGSGLVVIGNN